MRRSGLILDIGSGRYPTKADVSIDINPNSACEVIADVHSMPFRSDSFSSVMIFQTLEHLEAPSNALREIHRCLEPLGRLHCSIPNIMYYRRFVRWAFKGKTSVTTGHINAWGLPELTNLLRLTGFSLKSHTFVGTHYHRQSRFIRLLPRITKHNLYVLAEKQEMS
ncbi:MAG: class I SAM-dependent methyltransferase [Promethearchaeota archaeon]